jgi:hypothetical protein
LHLRALLQDSFFAVLGNHELLGLVVPIDLELGYAGLLSQDVAGEARNVGLGGRHLVELRGVILYVHVIADAQKFLIVVVRAREQDGRHAHDVSLGDVGGVGGRRLKYELHLAGLGAVHFCFFENLIVDRVGRLSNIVDSPGQT